MTIEQSDDADLLAAVERIRADQERTRAERGRGRKAGADWALRKAGYGELLGLDLLDDRWNNSGAGRYSIPLPRGSWSKAEAVAFDLLPQHKRTRRAAAAFWLGMAGVERAEPSNAMVDGFVDGALAAWREVRRKLDSPVPSDGN